ncbi:MAG: alcohol dehydrogenase catalytic domain-containing protein [Phycisphaerae bacterium]|nr:alcohol dehydrogenase catalytic domain-containing protein [Phycisphaerae bacterium]
MKAAYLSDIRTVEIRDEPAPSLTAPGEVLLGVEAVGVCGSDMHYYRTGRIGDQVVKFPWLIGHEMGATVLETAPDVTHLSAGQRVAVDPLIPCGQCDQCRSGRRHTCRNQRFLGCPGQAPGCLAERIVMPADCCFPVPDSVDALGAALVEPASVGVYARALSAVPAGEPVAILGAGPIGLSVLRACQAAGLDTAYVTEIREWRASLAADLGATWTGGPHREDIVGAIREREPDGVAAVFECAGEQSTLDEALAVVRPGGQVLMVGIPAADRVAFDASTLRREEITIRPVRRQNNCIPQAVELVARDADLRKMVTHEYALSATQQAFETVADYRDGVVKAIIRMR